MKRVIKCSNDIFGMSNLNPKKARLGNIIIWSEHGGVNSNVAHSGTPRVKMSIGDMSISVSISANPEIKSKNKNVTKHKISEFDRGIEYVARNYDVFLKHYNDTDFEFDDEDFF